MMKVRNIFCLSKAGTHAFTHILTVKYYVYLSTDMIFSISASKFMIMYKIVITLSACQSGPINTFPSKHESMLHSLKVHLSQIQFNSRKQAYMVSKRLTNENNVHHY